MVNGVVSVQEDLGNREEGVALLEQFFQDARKGLGGVLGGVVEEHDGAGLNLFGDPLGDFGSGEVFPVQAVTIPNRCKGKTSPQYFETTRKFLCFIIILW